ncbi:hypothetical protein PAMP_015759 [Pampus punctatissimus]
MSETHAREHNSTSAKYPSAGQGAVYLYDCPRQPYIPIYLLVKGVFSLLPSVVIRQTTTDNPGMYRGSAGGNVWIYSIYEPNYNKTSMDPYCDKALYLFAFWSTNLTYILILLGPVVILVCACCGFTCLMCCEN